MKITKAKAIINKQGEWITILQEYIPDNFTGQYPMILSETVTREDIEKMYPNTIDWKEYSLVNIAIQITDTIFSFDM